MPVLILDTEQAELIGIASEMQKAALLARSRRADPDGIISQGMELQASKLQTVLDGLKAPEPPDWSGLDAGLKRRARDLLQQLALDRGDPSADDAWRELRSLINAPGFSPRQKT